MYNVYLVYSIAPCPDIDVDLPIVTFSRKILLVLVLTMTMLSFTNYRTASFHLKNPRLPKAPRGGSYIDPRFLIHHRFLLTAIVIQIILAARAVFGLP